MLFLKLRNTTAGRVGVLTVISALALALALVASYLPQQAEADASLPSSATITKPRITTSRQPGHKVRRTKTQISFTRDCTADQDPSECAQVFATFNKRERLEVDFWSCRIELQGDGEIMYGNILNVSPPDSTDYNDVYNPPMSKNSDKNFHNGNAIFTFTDKIELLIGPDADGIIGFSASTDIEFFTCTVVGDLVQY